MRKGLIIITATLLSTLLCGCFKEVISYTLFRTAIYEQATTDGGYIHSTDAEVYAFYADTTEWKIASWEDAMAHRITNKTTGEQRDTPDAFGSFNASEEYQSSIRLEHSAMMVMLFPEAKVYAYRKYELPENLAEVTTKLYIATWRPSYNSAGWRVENRFYTPPAAN
jgi:hypothetical protein